MGAHAPAGSAAPDSFDGPNVPTLGADGPDGKRHRAAVNHKLARAVVGKPRHSRLAGFAGFDLLFC
jgi:hypothetical protein